MAQNAAQHAIYQQTLYQRSMNQGALNEGAMNQGAMNQGAMNQNVMNQHAIRQRRQNTWPLTTELYLYNNILQLLYFDDRNIENRPVGISVYIHPFEEPYIYFLEGYTTNHTRALNHFVYYGRNNDEVNHMRTYILNKTNEARDILNSIINTYIE